MKLTAEACVAFERDINLFIDHELPASDTPQLVEHLEACGACHDYVDDLRELAAVHRQMGRGPDGGGADSAVADLVDRHALFASITKTLLLDKREELARLLYELGKAYVLAGNEAAAAPRRRSVLPVKRPVDVRSAVERGRRLAREGEALSGTPEADAPVVRASGSLFRRSRRLFVAPVRAGAGALANGNRLLLEALAIRPDFDEARLYLGFHHMLVGRLDRATAFSHPPVGLGRMPLFDHLLPHHLAQFLRQSPDFFRELSPCGNPLVHEVFLPWIAVLAIALTHWENTSSTSPRQPLSRGPIHARIEKELRPIAPRRKRRSWRWRPRWSRRPTSCSATRSTAGTSGPITSTVALAPASPAAS